MRTPMLQTGSLSISNSLPWGLKCSWVEVCAPLEAPAFVYLGSPHLPLWIEM